MIVVGVNGSEGAQKALSWALAEARVQGVDVRAVAAWDVPVPAYAGPGFIPPIDPNADRTYEQAAERTLRAALEAAAAEADGVHVELVASRGQASQVLVEASADAEPLVVGSRGRGGFAGLLLGSVSQQSAHHARCPVVIVPPETVS